MKTPERSAPEATLVQGSNSQRYARNAVWLLVGEVGGKIASLVFVVFVARSLGATQYGYFSFALSYAGIFLLFGAWGIRAALLRDLARDRDRISELFASGLVLRTAFGAAGMIAALALSPLFVNVKDAFLTVLIVGTAVFFDELSTFLEIVFNAFERMKFGALALLINRFVSTVLAVLVLLFARSLVWVSVTYMAGSLLALSFAWYTLKRFFPPVHLRDARRATVVTLLKEGAPLGVATFLNSTLFRVDSVMLQALRGATEVGIYGAAYRFLESFLFVSWAIATPAFPQISRAGKGERSLKTYVMAMTLILSFYLPVAVIGPFAARWAVVELFSARYAAASRAVFWLTTAAALYAIAYTSRLCAIALGDRKRVVAIAAITLAINVALNAVFIPRFGFVAAAANTAIAEVIEATLLTLLFLRSVDASASGRSLVIPVTAAAVTGVLLWITGVHGLSAVVVAALVYPSALIVSARLIAPDVLGQARSFLRTRRG
ncbi:MAG: flippase [Actinomycetota bacterium]|nr:flippase [Actinomycetota bacterium]